MPMRDKMLASEIGKISQVLQGVDLTPFQSQAVRAIQGMCTTFTSTELTVEDKNALTSERIRLSAERKRDVALELATSLQGMTDPVKMASLINDLPTMQQTHKDAIVQHEAKIDALQSKKSIAALNEYERLMLGRTSSSNGRTSYTGLDNVVLKIPIHKKGYRLASVAPNEFYVFSVEPETHSVTALFSNADVLLHPDLAKTTTVYVTSATTARKVVSCYVDGYRGSTGIDGVVAGFNASHEHLNCGGVGRNSQYAKPLTGKANDWLLTANAGNLPVEKERAND